MPPPVKRRSQKAGLPPGSLVHIGEKRTEQINITLFNYDEEQFQELTLKSPQECSAFKDQLTVTWINLEGLHEVGAIESIGEQFGLHPLVMEDILNTEQRPKIEDFGDYLYIVLKMFSLDTGQEKVQSEQISLILTRKFVLSFQEGLEEDAFDPLRERIRTDKGRIRKMGADYLAYSVIDAIVDNYFVILEKLGEKVEELQEELVVRPDPHILANLHRLKSDMIILRKAVWPLREVISNLERGESLLIQSSTKLFLRDVYDHTIQVIDSIETFRDMLSGMLDIYLSSLSYRMNEIMKVLTIIATLFIPLTFIVGIYGMNFKYMPELDWRWGYLVVWMVMIVVGVGLLLYFRNKKWF